MLTLLLIVQFLLTGLCWVGIAAAAVALYNGNPLGGVIFVLGSVAVLLLKSILGAMTGSLLAWRKRHYD